MGQYHWLKTPDTEVYTLLTGTWNIKHPARKTVRLLTAALLLLTVATKLIKHMQCCLSDFTFHMPYPDKTEMECRLRNNEMQDSRTEDTAGSPIELDRRQTDVWIDGICFPSSKATAAVLSDRWESFICVFICCCFSFFFFFFFLLLCEQRAYSFPLK